MSNRRTISAPKIKLGWRGPVVYALVLLGLLSVLLFSVVHWTERQLLTTDNWVAMVAPLPQNPTVNNALSTYTVNQLFKGINVQQQITNVLPDKADFLSPYLSTQLKTFVTKVSSNVIGSSQFQTIWIEANKAAHSKLMTLARQNPPPSFQKATNFTLKLNSIEDKVASVLGKNEVNLFGNNTPTSSTAVSLTANLKTSFNTFRKLVSTIDFLNGTLGLLALVLLIGAIVLGKNRRRVILFMAVGILVVGLIELIAIKAIRPEVLNQVNDPTYRPAVGVIYDTLFAMFKNSATVTAFVGVVLWLIAFVLHRPYLDKISFISKAIASVEKSKYWQKVRQARDYVRRYLWQISGLAVLATLGILAFVTDTSAQGLVRASLILILVVECIILIAARARRRPMKQA